MKRILIIIVALLTMVQISHAQTYKTLKLFGDQSYFLVTGMILDYDTTLAAASDQRIPTQKALKTYIDTSISTITPISGGSLGQIYRYGTLGAAWSTSTFADTYAKGTFLYNATANTVDAFPHPGAANYLIATNSADGVGYFASSADMIAMLGSADYATFRTNAGLQAYSAVLTGIGATTPAAGLLGYTGASYDWFTGISLSNSSLRHFYDDTAGYYSNTDCTGFHTPALCCNDAHPDAGNTCAPKYVGIDPSTVTGTKQYTIKPIATVDTTFSPGATFTDTKWCSFATATGLTCTETAPAAVGQTFYIGTTQVAINRATNALTLAGITLTTPVIGAATGTSLIVTGRLDGLAGMLITTAASPTTIVVATHGSSSYFMNIGNSAANSIFTLPTAAAGLQYCIKNYTGISAVMKFQTSAAGQYIDLDGTLTATGGLIKSAGAAGDAACVVGVDATHWVAYVQKGVWSRD